MIGARFIKDLHIGPESNGLCVQITSIKSFARRILTVAGKIYFCEGSRRECKPHAFSVAIIKTPSMRRMELDFNEATRQILGERHLELWWSNELRFTGDWSTGWQYLTIKLQERPFAFWKEGEGFSEVRRIPAKEKNAKRRKRRK